MRDFTTPPPSSRPRTPPAPRHGPRHDSYQPYSPRRSKRVLHLQQTKEAQSITSLSRKSSSSQTLSPPSSPVAAQKVSLSHQTPARTSQSLFTRAAQANTNSTHIFSSVSHLATPATMLPTPDKTPRKRAGATLQSTARVLNFQPAPMAAPTPRRKPKSRLTLDKDDEVHEPVQVYTDSKDRIPTRDESSDNPFLGPRQPNNKPKGRDYHRNRPHTTSAAAKPATDAMDLDHHNNDKGILFMFRGKPLLRRFDDDSDSSTGSNDGLRRQIGPSAFRTITRTDLEPRVLFPTEHSDNDADSEAAAAFEEHVMADADEEEAMTDIEDDNMPTSAAASFGRLAQPAMPVNKTTDNTKTPAKKTAFAMPVTPPSSHRQTRSAAYQMPVFEDDQDMNAPALYTGGKRAHGEKRKGLGLLDSAAPPKRGRIGSSSVRRLP